MISSATMLPVHDHLDERVEVVEHPPLGDGSGWDGANYHDPGGIEVRRTPIDTFEHDPRCQGECDACHGADACGLVGHSCYPCSGCNGYSRWEANFRLTTADDYAEHI